MIIALGAALPAFAFGDDVGMTFKPDSSRVVRVLARIVDNYQDVVNDSEQSLIVRPRDQFNNKKLSDLIETLRLENNGEPIRGTFRRAGKKLQHVEYIFDMSRDVLKVRVNGIHYIIGKLRFIIAEED